MSLISAKPFSSYSSSCKITVHAYMQEKLGQADVQATTAFAFSTTDSPDPYAQIKVTIRVPSTKQQSNASSQTGDLNGNQDFQTSSSAMQSAQSASTLLARMKQSGDYLVYMSFTKTVWMLGSRPYTLLARCASRIS